MTMNAPTPQQLLEQLANPPTPYTNKLVALAKSMRADEDEEARHERRMQERQDDYWEARSADREELDGLPETTE